MVTICRSRVFLDDIGMPAITSVHYSSILKQSSQKIIKAEASTWPCGVASKATAYACDLQMGFSASSKSFCVESLVAGAGRWWHL